MALFNDGKACHVEDIIELCIAEWVQELLLLGIIQEPIRIEHLPKRFMARADVPVTPCIEMLRDEDLDFAFEPILLAYDADRDIFIPMESTYGSVNVDITMITTPSRFFKTGNPLIQPFTIKVTRGNPDPKIPA